MQYTGGDIRHHPDCVFYPGSLTFMHDRLESQLQDAIAAISLCATIAHAQTNGKTEYAGDGYGFILKLARETLAKLGVK